MRIERIKSCFDGKKCKVIIMVKYVYDDNKKLVHVDELNKKQKEDDIDDEIFYDKLNDIEYMRRCISYTGAIDPTRTVGYARVSSKQYQNIENQLAIFRELGIEHIFSDRMSGFKYKGMERPAFRDMMKYIEMHPNINTLIIYELSRLGRNWADSIDTWSKLTTEKNINIISLTEPFTHNVDEDNKKILVSIFAWLNEQESKRTSLRTKAGQYRARQEKGIKIGRLPKVYFQREFVENLRERGWSWDEIAHHKDVRCHVSTIYRARKQWEIDDNLGTSHYKLYEKSYQRWKKNQLVKKGQI